MEKKKQEQLRQLINDEIEFRRKFREARKVLEDLIDPISNHNLACNEFWRENFSEDDEVVVVLDDINAVKIVRPTREVAKVESYMPYGFDFNDMRLIDIE